MKMIPAVFRSVLALLVLGTAVAQAASVSGTVINKTTGKPAVGDKVVLVEPMSGMSEVGTATSDAKGHYSLNLPGSNPYLVRVTHQGADYFLSVPQGGGSADATVYDVAAKVEGLKIDEHVIAAWSKDNQLHIVERYTLHNTATPARTQWSKNSFEIILPQDATVGDSSAQRAGASSLPTNVKIDPTGTKGHYSFNFPIQPDQDGKGTLFQVRYTVPYNKAKYAVHTEVTLPATTTWVVLPKEITFSGDAAGFMPAPQEPNIQTFVTKLTPVGKALEFTISGNGDFPDEAPAQQNGMGQQDGDGNMANGQPGGGIGAPIESPDPISKYKWWIFGVLALALAGGAAFLLRAPAGAATVAGAAPVATPGAVAAGDTVLAALKEELFKLESDRLAGSISDAEYAEAKQALEVVLKRALKKQS